MDKKVILISIDGLRPDGALQCGNPYVQELMKMGSYCLNARTVFPSSTMPCHMSMFYSMPPEKHGTMELYEPPKEKLYGIFEQLQAHQKDRVMYTGWEPLRELSRPISLNAMTYIDSYSSVRANVEPDTELTTRMIQYEYNPPADFIFLHLGMPDCKGHRIGWMSDEYLEKVSIAFDNVKRVIDAMGDRYTIIITSDHGGHDTCHGTLKDEDMTIPVFCVGPEFPAGKEITEPVSIMDIPPTIFDVMNVPPHESWEGKSLLGLVK